MFDWEVPVFDWKVPVFKPAAARLHRAGQDDCSEEGDRVATELQARGSVAEGQDADQGDDEGFEGDSHLHDWWGVLLQFGWG